MQKPLKILHATGNLDRGGIETWLLQMVRQIDRSKYQIDVLLDHDRECDYSQDFRAAGCRILPCLHPKQPWRYAGGFKRLYRQFGPYDIVHSHVHYFSGLVLALAKNAGVPVRIVHAYPVGDLKPTSPLRSIYRAAAFTLLRHATTHVLACSKATLRAYQHNSGIRTPVQQVLYDAVDLQAFEKTIDVPKVRAELGLPIGTPVVSYVARFFPHKNHEQILRIANQINRSQKRVHFAFAGSWGPCLNSIVERTAVRKDVTTFTGMRDISDLLLASDAFIFPSLQEGFGIVALEAAAAGLPIIAADWDTIREACPPSHREFMFEPDNDEEAISKLEEILSNSPLRARLSRDGKEWVKGFSIEASLNQLTSFYDQAAAERPERQIPTQAPQTKPKTEPNV